MRMSNLSSAGFEGWMLHSMPISSFIFFFSFNFCMASQFIFCLRKVIEQRKKKLSVSGLLTLVTGQFLSKPHQAQTAFWQFQLSCKQPRSCEMIQKIPKILDMPIYIYFRLNIFMNVITWKKKPNSYENLASYTLDSTYKLISCINWIACFLVAYADFLSCSKIQLQWGYIPHCIDNFLPLWRDHMVCYNENPSFLVRVWSIAIEVSEVEVIMLTAS